MIKTHEAGAKRHGVRWMEMNQVACDAIVECGYSPADPNLKVLAPKIVLRMLDRIKMKTHRWLPEEERWVENKD